MRGSAPSRCDGPRTQRGGARQAAGQRARSTRAAAPAAPRGSRICEAASGLLPLGERPSSLVSASSSSTSSASPRALAVQCTVALFCRGGGGTGGREAWSGGAGERREGWARREGGVDVDGTCGGAANTGRRGGERGAALHLLSGPLRGGGLAQGRECEEGRRRAWRGRSQRKRRERVCPGPHAPSANRRRAAEAAWDSLPCRGEPSGR